MSRGDASEAAGRAKESESAAAGLASTNRPFQAASIRAKAPGANQAPRGLALRLAPDAAVVFDTELLRMAAGWTGDFGPSQKLVPDGKPPVLMAGDQRIGTAPVRGWVVGAGEFDDPRPQKRGALPGSMGKWNGLYLAGERMVLHYTIGGLPVLEEPHVVRAGKEIGFARAFKLDALKDDVGLLVCEAPDAMAMANMDGSSAILNTPGDRITRVGGVGLPKNARFEASGARVVLRLPKGAPAGVFKVVVWSGAREMASLFDQMTQGKAEILDVKSADARLVSDLKW